MLGVFFCLSSAFAQELEPWQDFKDSLNYLVQGSYLQFTQKKSWWMLGIGGTALSYSFMEDHYYLEKIKDDPPNAWEKGASEAAVPFAFPIVSLSAYGIAAWKNKTKELQFAKEYFATLYLAELESAALSAIPIHKRPDGEGLRVWEKRFRLSSSFPSGHVIPFATLGFKVLQFYGPWWSILPFSLCVLTSAERLKSQRHYLSDVVGALLISGLASEGVRIAAQRKDNLSPSTWQFSPFPSALGILASRSF